jgi:hypothetical protein
MWEAQAWSNFADLVEFRLPCKPPVTIILMAVKLCPEIWLRGVTCVSPGSSSARGTVPARVAWCLPVVADGQGQQLALVVAGGGPSLGFVQMSIQILANVDVECQQGSLQMSMEMSKIY